MTGHYPSFLVVMGGMIMGHHSSILMSRWGGWGGRCGAVQCGAASAEGEWLLTLQGRERRQPRVVRSPLGRLRVGTMILLIFLAGIMYPDLIGDETIGLSWSYLQLPSGFLVSTALCTLHAAASTYSLRLVGSISTSLEPRQNIPLSMAEIDPLCIQDCPAKVEPGSMVYVV
jgi:hypothetical protein